MHETFQPVERHVKGHAVKKLSSAGPDCSIPFVLVRMVYRSPSPEELDDDPDCHPSAHSSENDLGNEPQLVGECQDPEQQAGEPSPDHRTGDASNPRVAPKGWTISVGHATEAMSNNRTTSEISDFSGADDFWPGFWLLQNNQCCK